MDWSLVISVLAFCFSLFTYILNDRKIKKQEKLINTYHIEKIQEEKKELKSALIKANIINKAKGNEEIRIFNAGKSSAKNINFEIISEHQGIHIINNEIFPYELLNPQDYTELFIILAMNHSDKIKVKFTWDDEYKTGNVHEQVLTL